MNINRPAIALIILVCMLLSSQVARAESRYAVIVGQNFGMAHEEPLRFAERDAERIRDVLVALGNVPKKNTHLLRGASKKELLDLLSRLRDQLIQKGDSQKNSTLFFYFAGHGDEETIHLGRNALSREELLHHLKGIPVSLRLAILDSCQTARMERSRGVRTGEAFDIGVVDSSQQEGTVVIRSTGEGEPAHESDALGGALFTHYLISALRGAGDMDQDGQVTLLEAYTYSYRNTVQHSARGSSSVQHPSFEMEFKGSGELSLTEPVKANAKLVLPAGENVHYLVFRQPSGTVVAEVIGLEKRSVLLAVPSGTLLVQRRSEDRFWVTQVELPYGGRRELTIKDFIEQSYEEVVRRGNPIGLRPNEIGLGYSIRTDHFPSQWIRRNGPTVFYRRKIAAAWTIGTQIGFDWSRYDQAGLAYTDTLIELSGMIGWLTMFGVTRLLIAVGPELQMMFQKSRRTVDRDRLEAAGIPLNDIRNNCISIGGGLRTSWSIPISGRWWAMLAVQASILALNVDEDDHIRWRAIPQIEAGVGVEWHF